MKTVFRKYEFINIDIQKYFRKYPLSKDIVIEYN